MEFLEEHMFLSNSLWKWTLCLCYVVGACLVSILMRKLLRSLFGAIGSKSGNKELLISIHKPIVFFIILIGFRLGIVNLTFDESIDKTIANVFTAAVTVAITWFFARVVKSIVGFAFSRFQKTHDGNEVQVLKIIRNTIDTVIWVFGIITAINNVGYDVGALLAGLGIGGLAMALAAQNTASNIFGGVTIFVDRPFSLGDRIRIGGFDGTVETIGLRNIKLRTLQGTLVSIPNSKITDSLVENVTLEPSHKQVQTLGLVYETTHEQMKQAMATLEDIVKSHQDILMPTYKIYFDSFGDFSLNITMVYYMRVGGDYFMIASQINMEILERFNALKLDFAFPSQTLYVKK